MESSIISAGIDVGTTTTHLVISRLHFVNLSTANKVPRLEICKREILHKSDIHFTPLTDEGLIDGQGVAAIVAREYAIANLSADDIDSGAAIITGETARIRNARDVINMLSEIAGDFVAASAGAHLESILSARGSGAVLASRERHNTICNIDIGGGTTNIAIFSDGELLDTSCIGIGGRCMKVSPEYCLLSLSDSGEIFLDAVGRRFKPGQILPEEELIHIGNLLAEAIVQYLTSARAPQVTERLLTVDPLRFDYEIDEFWFSGGVAEFMQSPPGNPLLYGDLGGYLAAGLLGSIEQRQLKHHFPEMPIRATVIGAGLHSLQLSGCTVHTDEAALPLRNLPLIKPFGNLNNQLDLVSAIELSLKDCLRHHDLDWSTGPVAIVLNELPALDYQSLGQWAQGLSAAFSRLSGTEPMVIIATQDIGLALGQLLRQHLPHRQLIVLDGITSLDGDFVDIGKSITAGQALPVVVKDLVFAINGNLALKGGTHEKGNITSGVVIDSGQYDAGSGR